MQTTTETQEKKRHPGRAPSAPEYFLGEVIFPRLLSVGDSEILPKNIDYKKLKDRMTRLADKLVKETPDSIEPMRKFVLVESGEYKKIIRTA